MKKKSTLLYITYVDISDTVSGSRVRPFMMQKALSEKFDLMVLSGDQTNKERRKKVGLVRKALKRNKPDLCYIESPTYPIIKHCDRAPIAQIHMLGIPIGYFYRDFYRKFPLNTNKKSIARKAKDTVLDFLQFRTDHVLNNCDIIYFPSEECKELFHYKDMRALPPAGENHISETEKELNYTCIYVGGIIGHYDGCLLLDTFGELHKRDDRYRLILVCRAEEWSKFNHPLKQEKWIEVHHTSGEGLVELYNRAQIALVVHKKNEYNKYAIPVKTFEYMSYGLPIVSVNIQALARFITNEGIGIVVDSDPSSFADGIQTIFSNQQIYNCYVQNTKVALLNHNLWSHRVETVTSDLFSKRNNNGKK